MKLEYDNSIESGSDNVQMFFDNIEAIHAECRQIGSIASALFKLGIPAGERLLTLSESILDRADAARNLFSERIDMHAKSATAGTNNMLAAMIAGLEIGARK